MGLIVITIIVSVMAIYNTINCIICYKLKDELSNIVEESIGTEEYVELETMR